MNPVRSRELHRTQRGEGLLPVRFRFNAFRDQPFPDQSHPGGREGQNLVFLNHRADPAADFHLKPSQLKQKGRFSLTVQRNPAAEQEAELFHKEVLDLRRIAAPQGDAVQVQPVFGSVNGLYSKVASLVYQPADNRPTLTLTRTSKGLDVSWKAQSGATEYILYYKVENGDWTQFKTPYTTVHMSKMVSGTKYSFQIRMIR